MDLKNWFRQASGKDVTTPISSQEMAEMQRVASNLDAQVGNSAFSQALANDPYEFKTNIMPKVKGGY